MHGTIAGITFSIPLLQALYKVESASRASGFIGSQHIKETEALLPRVPTFEQDQYEGLDVLEGDIFPTEIPQGADYVVLKEFLSGFEVNDENAEDAAEQMRKPWLHECRVGYAIGNQVRLNSHRIDAHITCPLYGCALFNNRYMMVSAFCGGNLMDVLRDEYQSAVDSNTPDSLTNHALIVAVRFAI